MTKRIKIISIAALIIVCLVMSGCWDCRYEYYFSVEGGNGVITRRVWHGADNVKDYDSPVFWLGYKKDGHELELTAIPDEGYQVKQWVCNGEIVAGNKTNSFTAVAPNYEHDYTRVTVIVTVEFELMPDEQ